MDFITRSNSNLPEVSSTNESDDLQIHSHHLKRIKKQAKRLFQFAQQNNKSSIHIGDDNSIKIDNLAAAQHVLAIMNGFPHWHALQKNILDNENEQPFVFTHQEVESIIPSSQSLSNNELWTIPDKLGQYPIYYKIRSEEIHSFLKVTCIKSNSIGSFLSSIKDIKQKISFQFNMGFHNIEFFLIKNKIAHIQPDNHSHFVDYQLMKVADNWNLSQEFTKKLFNINIKYDNMIKNDIILGNKTNEKADHDFNIIVVLSTSVDMKSEHTIFCDNIINSLNKKDKSIFIEVKDTLNHAEHDLIINNVTTNDVYKFEQAGIVDIQPILWKKLFHSGFDIWPYLIHLLSQKKEGWDIHIDIKNNHIQLYYENLHSSPILSKYLNGILKSVFEIQHTDNTVYPMFFYGDKLKNDTHLLPGTYGLGLLSAIDGKVNYTKENLLSQHIELIYAKPGSGKSLLMCSKILDTAINSDPSNLSHIGIIDVGPTTKGIISLMQDSLADNQKHLIQYHRIRMTEEYCTNPFDIQLGYRFPTPEEKTLLVNFILLLTTEVNQDNPPDGMAGLVQAIVEDMYKRRSDIGQPKRYQKGENNKIDEIIATLKLKLDAKTTWWEIVDLLFIQNEFKYAKIAQRYAVPLLSDYKNSLHSDKIQSTYTHIHMSTGETLINYFSRLIEDSLQRYTILLKPTVFDISNARIVSLDLDEVAKSGGMQADRQTAVMYLLARYILGKDFKPSYNKDSLIYPSHILIPKNIPINQYNEYYNTKANESKTNQYHFYFDEFHRVSRSNIINNQILDDMREGRKWNTSITIASQFITDFNEQMTAFATDIFIMDVDNKNNIKEFINTFGIPDSFNYFNVYQNYIRGPRNGQSGVFMALMNTSTGKKINLFSLPLTPYLLWTLTTVSEDIVLRAIMVKKIGLEKTLEILSTHYPYGIKKYIESKKKERLNSDSIIPELANELLKNSFN